MKIIKEPILALAVGAIVCLLSGILLRLAVIHFKLGHGYILLVARVLGVLGLILLLLPLVSALVLLLVERYRQGRDDNIPAQQSGPTVESPEKNKIESAGGEKPGKAGGASEDKAKGVEGPL